MTVNYPDISHYQGGLSLAGAPLVVAKATQGTGGTDPAYAGFVAQAASRGIPLAAYHWLDASDPVAQARHCFSVVGRRPLMIDDETPPVSVGRTLAFVAEYRRLGGVVHLEYLPHWAWQASGSPDLRPLAAAGLALAASNYSAGAGAPGGAGWTPYGGMSPAIVQYTDAHPFNGASVDFNIYPGTLADLLALINGGHDMNLTDTVNTVGGPKTVADILGDVWNATFKGGGPAATATKAELDVILTAETGQGAADAAAIADAVVAKLGASLATSVASQIALRVANG